METETHLASSPTDKWFSYLTHDFMLAYTDFIIFSIYNNQYQSLLINLKNIKSLSILPKSFNNVQNSKIIFPCVILRLINQCKLKMASVVLIQPYKLSVRNYIAQYVKHQLHNLHAFNRDVNINLQMWYLCNYYSPLNLSF